MGKLLPFRRKRRAAARPPRFGKRRRSFPGRTLRALGALAGLLALGALAVVYTYPHLVGMPDFLSTEPQSVEARFVPCYGRKSGPHTRACVIDGDSFMVAGREYRVRGIDAPEMRGACDAERKAAIASARALRDWLNRGAFTMRGRIDDATDRYGRALRELYREDADGQRRYFAPQFIAAGHARAYSGGGRGAWCS